MNHNEYKKLLKLILYDELNSNEQNILEAHLKCCEECRNELDQQRNMLSLISSKNTSEVDDNFLFEARSQLRGAIRNERRHAGYFESLIRYILDFITVPFRTVLSGAVILSIGFAAGYLFFGNSGVKPNEVLQNPDNGFSLIQNDVAISNLTFIDSNPFDGEVEFTFVAVKPMTLKGSVDDPKIHSILTYAMLNEQNPGARLNSINAMDSGNLIALDKDVKNALITVLLTDKNQGVKREALKLMKKFPYDEDIKQALIYILTNDTSSGLRIEAINALVENVRAGQILNKKDLDLFKQKLQTDDNSYIRFRTKTILQEFN
jgi:hypothetical protein